MLLGLADEGNANSDGLLILGSAVNQDGRSSSLTAPNGPAQQDAVLTALADAEATPAGQNVLQVRHFLISSIFILFRKPSQVPC